MHHLLIPSPALWVKRLWKQEMMLISRSPPKFRSWYEKEGIWANYDLAIALERAIKSNGFAKITWKRRNVFFTRKDNFSPVKSLKHTNFWRFYDEIGDICLFLSQWPGNDIADIFLRKMLLCKIINSLNVRNIKLT